MKCIFGLGIWEEFLKPNTVFTELILTSNLLISSGSHFHSLTYLDPFLIFIPFLQRKKQIPVYFWTYLFISHQNQTQRGNLILYLDLCNLMPIFVSFLMELSRFSYIVILLWYIYIRLSCFIFISPCRVSITNQTLNLEQLQ